MNPDHAPRQHSGAGSHTACPSIALPFLPGHNPHNATDFLHSGHFTDTSTRTKGPSNSSLVPLYVWVVFVSK